jgi:hypothetical protein
MFAKQNPVFNYISTDYTNFLYVLSCTENLNNLNIEAAFIYQQNVNLSVQLLSDDGKPKCENSFRSQTETLEIQ